MIREKYPKAAAAPIGHAVDDNIHLGHIRGPVRVGAGKLEHRRGVGRDGLGRRGDRTYRGWLIRRLHQKGGQTATDVNLEPPAVPVVPHEMFPIVKRSGREIE